MSSEDLHERNQSLHRVIMGNSQGKKSDLSDDILNGEMENNADRAEGDGAASCDDGLTDSEGDLLNSDQGDDGQDQNRSDSFAASMEETEAEDVANISVIENYSSDSIKLESASPVEAMSPETAETKPDEVVSEKIILPIDGETTVVHINGLLLSSDISESDDVFIDNAAECKEDALCDDQIVAELLNLSSSVEEDLEIEMNERVSLSTNEDDESLEEEKHNLHHVQGPCFCLTCKSKSERQMEILHLKSDWKDVQKFINCIYSSIMKCKVPASEETIGGILSDDEIKLRVTRLVAYDPYQLYLGLVKILENYSEYIHGVLWTLLMISDQHLSPNTFLEQMFEKYDQLTTAARRVAPVIEPFQVQYLDHLNMTWDILNKYHFQNQVYSDKLVQENLPLFIAQLRNLLSSKREAYQEMIRFYLAFDDEMNIVKAMWQESNTLLQKFKQDQAAMKERQNLLHTRWELFKAQRHQTKQNDNESQGSGFGGKHPGGGDAPPGIFNGVVHGDVIEDSDEGEEFAEVPESPQQSCECHVCTAPPVSTGVDLVDDYGCQMCLEVTRMSNGVGPRLPGPFLDHQHHFNPNNFQYYPFGNGSAGGGGDSNGVYPHLYNVHPSLLSQLGSKDTHLGTNQETETIDCEPCPPMAPAPLSSPALQNQLKAPTLEKDSPLFNLPMTLSSPTFNKTVSIPTSTATLSSVRMSRSPSTTTTPALNCQQNNLCTCQSSPCPRESPPPHYRVRASSLPTASVNGHAPDRAPVHKSPAAADAHGSQTLNQQINIPHSQPAAACSAAPKVRNSTTQTSTGILNQPTVHHHAHSRNGPVRRSNGKVPEHICVNGITAGGDGKALSCDASCSAEDEYSSSPDGSCSSTPSTQRDPRHCDCCYCEVFGHGPPTVAPTSRNYQEMRERLRQLLTKKKAKCRSPAVQSPPPASPAPAHKPPPPVQGQRVPTEPAKTVQSGPGRGPVPKAAPAEAMPAAAVAPTAPLPARMVDTRPVEDLVDFIEGNRPPQPKVQESKNAAKKARRKQKKLMEEQQRLEVEEMERQRLLELQAKTPEVTITVLKNGVPHSLGLPQPPQNPPQNKSRNAKGMEVKVARAPVTTAKSIHEHIKSQVGEAGLNRQEPQMVTIKRVMEPNSVEPTVTITLKGATPDKDKVLFTLVNGQNEVVPEPPQPARKTKKQIKKEKQRLQRQLLQEKEEEEEKGGKVPETDKTKAAPPGIVKDEVKSEIAVDDEFDITLEQLGKKERKRLRKQKLQEINMQRDAEKKDREEKERREREKKEEERRLEELFEREQKELDRLQVVFRSHQERLTLLQQQKQLSRKQRKQDQKLQQDFVRTQQQLEQQEEQMQRLRKQYPAFYHQKVQKNQGPQKRGQPLLDVNKDKKSKQNTKEQELKQQQIKQQQLKQQQLQQQQQQLKQQQLKQQQLQQQQLKQQQLKQQQLQQQQVKQQQLKQQLQQQQQIKQQQLRQLQQQQAKQQQLKQQQLQEQLQHEQLKLQKAKLVQEKRLKEQQQKQLQQQKQQKQVQTNQKQLKQVQQQPKQTQPQAQKAQQQKQPVQQPPPKPVKQQKQPQQPIQQVQQLTKKQLQKQQQEEPKQLTKKQLKQFQQLQISEQPQKQQKQKQQQAQKQEPAPQKLKKQQQPQSTKKAKQKTAEQPPAGLDWATQNALASARPRVTLQPTNSAGATGLEQRFSNSLSLNSTPLIPSLHRARPPPPVEHKAPFSLESLRLPPGITITKVDASHAPPRKQPIAKPQVTKTIVPNPAPTTIIAAPLSGRSSSGYGANQDPSSNVIVVDTGKLKQELLVKEGAPEGEKKKKKKKRKKKSVSEEESQHQQMRLSSQIPPYLLNSVSISMAGQAAPPPPLPQAAIIKVNGNMVTIRNPAMHPSALPPPTQQPRLQPQVAVNGDAGRKSKKGSNSSNSKEKASGNFQNTKLTLQQATSQMNGYITSIAQANTKPQNQQGRQSQQVEQSQMSVQEKRRAVACMRKAMAAAAAENEKKGKKKGRKKNGQGNPDDWQLVDSVFAPKDIDLDNGDIDDDERELEAFKRFCLQSVPPKRKEKVHLNIKDIVLKNKTNSIGCN